MSTPDFIEELAKARLKARDAKDFAASDKLRSEINKAGYEVLDVAGGYQLREKSPYTTFQSIRGLKAIDLKAEITVAIIVDGFTEDAVLAIASIKKESKCAIVILCIGDPGGLVGEMDSDTYLYVITENPGWGECANALLNKVSSKYIIIMDPSTNFTGDAVGPVLEELKRNEYVSVGWRGGLINIEDGWKSVDDKGVGEVDVLFSYFIALDRAGAIAAGGFSSRAIYYRNADIEFSLKLRHANARLLQMDLPLAQGRHHGYHDVEIEYRDAQSKKNYDRILERFRGKSAILSPRR